MFNRDGRNLLVQKSSSNGSPVESSPPIPGARTSGGRDWMWENEYLSDFGQGIRK